MGKEIKTFGDIEVEKHKFHHRKNLVSLKDVDIKKIQAPSMVSFGKKITNILLVTMRTITKLSHHA